MTRVVTFGHPRLSPSHNHQDFPHVDLVSEYVTPIYGIYTAADLTTILCPQ